MEMYGKPKRIKKVYGGMQKNRYSAGGTPAMKLKNGGQPRTGYMKGSKVEMHKCMPN